MRAGRLAPGGAETVAEALDNGDARVVLVGDGASIAAAELTGLTPTVEAVPFTRFAPAAWARALAPVVRASTFVVLPASAGGRDLAPRLAAELGWPLLANAVAVSSGCVVVARQGGLVQTTIVPGAPFVATLEPGVRGTTELTGAAPPRVVELALELDPSTRDAEVLEELPPDVATMDLAEAPRIVGGGAGLMAGADDVVADRFARLAAVARPSAPRWARRAS